MKKGHRRLGHLGAERRTCMAGTVVLAACLAAVSAGAGAVEENVRQGPAFSREGPGGEAGRERPAKDWVTQAHTALREGNLYEARRYLEKAVELFPGETGSHFLLGMVLFRQKEFTWARYEMGKVLEIDPGHYGARELLGGICYQEGRLEHALVLWKEALRDSPHRLALEKKIEKAEKEIVVEEGFGRDVSRNFTVRYDGPIPRAVMSTVLWKLEESYRELERKLGSAPPEDIIVILYSRRNFHEITATPRWVGGTYDGKIRLPVGGLSTEEQAAGLGPVLTHELTHAFLAVIVGRRLPLWFEEGLAEHFERAPREDRNPRPRTHMAAAFPRLEDLTPALRGRGGAVEEAYDASAVAVEELIREKGFPAVRRILDEMEGGMNFAEALEEAAGLSLGELETLWKGAFAGRDQ